MPGSLTDLGYGWVMAVLAVGAVASCSDIFSLVYHFSFLSLSEMDGWMT